MSSHYNRYTPPKKPRFQVENLVFLIVPALMVLGFIAVIATALLNTAGQTEARATANADAWIQKNGITYSRKTCAHDSDGDGYGSCTVVTQAGEKIFLECVAGWSQGFTGASGCKEVDTLIKMNVPRARH